MSTLPPPGSPNDPTVPGHSEPAGGTGTLVQEEARQDVQAGDHERFAHYVRKEKITESAVTGTPVIALCGKVWVPGRDPSRFPVCPACKEIYESLSAGGSGGDDSGGSRRSFFGRGKK